MRKLLSLLFVLGCLPVMAADRITAIITVTNAPIGNTNSLTVNGSARLFTNDVTGSPGTLILETNSIPWTATNLLNQITDYRFSQFHFLGATLSNNVRIIGTIGEALTVSLAGNWGTVTYSTQTVSSPTFVVRVPMTVEQTSNRTHIASLLTVGISDNSTNSFATNAVATSNYITKGASPQQHIASPLHVGGILRAAAGVALTNGFTFSLTNINSVSTGHVNYGNAFRSEGSGGNSLQLGSNALAVGSLSVAIGNGSVASNTTTLAIGTLASATNDYSMAVGNNSLAGGLDSLAIGRSSQAFGAGAQAFGQGAIAQGASAVAFVSEVVGDASVGIGAFSSVSATNGTALGQSTSVTHNNSTAIGSSAASTTTNQVRIGTASDTVSIPGVLAVTGTITNATTRGTNTINAIQVFTPSSNTGLGNGYNAAVSLAAAFVKLSGPSAAYTNAGFASDNKMDGKRHLVQFDNPGLSVTILDNSALDSGPTNRIYTGTGALLNSTNNPAFLDIIYDNTATRWRVISFR